MLRKSFLALLLFTVAGLASVSAHADPQPGDACTAANTHSTSGGPENAGKVFTMTCQGGVWVRITESDTSGNLGVKKAAPKATLHVGGEAIIGATGLVCDADREGGLRWDSANKTFEMCNGTTWKSIVASSNLAALIVTPVANTNMNISTSGSPAYGSYATFTVENIGNVTSQPMTVELNNQGNFEIGTNTCAGNTLAAGATCTITVRPKSYGDGSYNGVLSISADTTTTATLSGTATGSCGTLGSSTGGGLLAACMSGYALIVMPAGCPDDSSDPVCTGTIDVTGKSYGQAATTNAFSDTNGQNVAGGNTYVLMARVSSYGESYPAAQYCADMTYNGYSDWYLPAFEELRAACLNQTHLPGFITNACPPGNCGYPYITSTEVTSSLHKRVYFNSGTCSDFCANGDCGKFSNFPIRCVRRQ